MSRKLKINSRTKDQKFKVVEYTVTNGKDSYRCLAEIAKQAASQDLRIDTIHLAGALNWCNIRTKSGRPFTVGTRGIYNTIRSAYYFFDAIGTATSKQYAEWIAEAYVRPNGEYAYRNN